METDSQKILTRAFQSLELFSVPGLGTFRRSYHPAHIDNDTKVITPPGERFVFERGEDYTDRLESFVAKTFDAGELAKDKVKELRSWIVRELKKGKPLNFPGIGKLELESDKEVNFVAEAGADASGDFFGLQPVAFTLGQPKAKTPAPKESTPDLKKKAAVAVAAVAVAATAAVATAAHTSTQAQAAVETPTLVETVAPPKRKSRAWLWLILVLLLVGAGTAGVIWREQVREQLVTWGWMTPSGGGGSTDGAGLADGGDAGDGEVTDGGNLTVPVDSGDGTDGSESTDEVEVEETPVAEADEVVGNFAQDGMFYLIVASGKDASSMKKMRRQMGGKVIRSPYEGNYYRLANFQSSSKDEVIEKMVASKDKFPNSWIFWKGM